MVWKYHVYNCATCHLPNIDGKIDLNLVVVPIDLISILCGFRHVLMLSCWYVIDVPRVGTWGI